MVPAARIAAAIEVVADIDARRRPAADALKDWGLSHRFAGSGDRAAIATLVYDALRRRASSRWLMGGETARDTVLGMLVLARGLDRAAIASLFSGERFAPDPLTETEAAALDAARLAQAPAFVQADVPEWLWPDFEAAFGADAIAEGRALAERAPLDLRTNTLRTSRDALKAALAPIGAVETPHSPWGLRVPLGPDGRGPSVQSEPTFIEGHFEIQDEGSQIAALIAAARPGETVLDLCAGAGGKTLELAAAMANEGRIIATDSDMRRLAPIHDRLKRAGATLVDVRTPRGKGLPIEDLAGTVDLALVDAPCSGSGTWRRNPDAKWRMRPNSLADRQKDQATVLEAAARTVKPGGRLVYVTCSVLMRENDEAVAGFIARHRGFAVVSPAEAAEKAGLGALGAFRSGATLGLQLTPHRCGTDGFFISVLRRTA